LHGIASVHAFTPRFTLAFSFDRSISRSHDKCTHVRSYEYAMRLGEHTLAAGCPRATTLFFASPSCAARSVLRALTLMCACASPMHPSIRSISDSHCRARGVVNMAGAAGVATKRNAVSHVPLRTVVWTWLLRFFGCACIVPVVSLIWTGWVRVAAHSNVACSDGLHAVLSVVLCIGGMVSHHLCSSGGCRSVAVADNIIAALTLRRDLFPQHARLAALASGHAQLC
jgi:hypothetical protein